MRSHRGIFWYSLGLTLLLLLPMVLTVAFFADQYQKQQLLRQASAADSTLRIEPGAQGVYRLLLIVQQEEPAFVLARTDGPKQTVTLCALPGSLLVNAPAGTTTLSECALSAGAGRAAQLLCGTVATGETAARSAATSRVWSRSAAHTRLPAAKSSPHAPIPSSTNGSLIGGKVRTSSNRVPTHLRKMAAVPRQRTS